MFESLTAYLPKLGISDYGEWIVDRENDGTPEHPIQFPWVLYGETVQELENAIYQFVDDHEDLGLIQYGEILEKSDLKWDMNSMRNADVSKLDGATVMALLLGAVRAERFCDGALLGFCESGCITKWLKRLKELDDGKC